MDPNSLASVLVKLNERPQPFGYEWRPAGVAKVEAEAKVREAYRRLQQEKAAAAAKADARDVRCLLG